MADDLKKTSNDKVSKKENLDLKKNDDSSQDSLKEKKEVIKKVDAKNKPNNVSNSKETLIKQSKESDEQKDLTNKNDPKENLQSENKKTADQKNESVPKKDVKNQNETLREKKPKLLTASNNVKDKQKSSQNDSDSSVNNDSNQKNLEQNEYIEKLVSINRVAKVVKGGRRFSFAALVVVGDRNGMVGHGKGKAKEVPEAIKKATDEAKATMIRVPLRHGKTLHHDMKGRFDSGKVYLRSAPSGTGVIAGGPMRAVFEALGIEDIVAKSVGSSNPHNMVRATFEALKNASSPKIIAMRRGLKINDITKRRKISEVSDNAKN